MPAPAVLLVDDDRSILEVAGYVLGDKGYRVLPASDGSEALEVLSRYKGPIPLVVTDIAMPGLNGVELAARIESLRPATKILFITAYGHLYDVGTHALLKKPFTPDQLLLKVRETLPHPPKGPKH